ncbi:hypothetical protein NUW54_g13519 [Trametes sanguinea]|uniref:Uncharacterized protein n=1 Tax=Trametes sanguinea TaxID=158606 RepID=A0ACC1ML54_9APHY|nr:hypothetical protein NUW54_g13519 [Trametes sanguinea]
MIDRETCRFAVKAVEHAQTYWNLLEKVNPRDLRLTKYVHPHSPRRDLSPSPQTHAHLLFCLFPPVPRIPSYRIDDEIYEHAMKEFPELAENDYEKLLKIDEDWMKSESGKKRWRDFIQQYEKKIQDYNFGSLIRTDARQEYSETNTIFGECLSCSCARTVGQPELTEPTRPGSHANTAKEKEKAEKEKARAEKEKAKKKKN